MNSIAHQPKTIIKLNNTSFTRGWQSSQSSYKNGLGTRSSFDMGIIVSYLLLILKVTLKAHQQVCIRIPMDKSAAVLMMHNVLTAALET